MRFTLREGNVKIHLPVVFFVATTCACSTSPTAPTISPQPPATTISGMVVHGEGCVEGAAVEVLSGPATGQKVVQETPCSVWDYPGIAFILTELQPKVSVALRITAPGYVTRGVMLLPTESPLQISMTPVS